MIENKSLGSKIFDVLNVVFLVIVMLICIMPVWYATIDWDAVRHSGISGAVPFVWHRMPGFGDTNWRDIISILRSNGYEDDICIEGYHDPVYSGELEMTGQLHALNYLKWCRGGDFTQTPWEK